MKIAVAGKGGSGKTIVSGTLARSFANAGYDVLAIDDDDDPNLGMALGIPPEATLPSPPDDLVTRREASEGELPYSLSEPPRAVIDNHATTAPGGVTLLTAGSVVADSCCFGTSHVTARLVLSNLVEDHDEVTIMDMPNGVEHLGIGTAEDVDILLVVAEPTYNSLTTVDKTNTLATELGIPMVHVVANKVRDDHDREVIEEFCTDHDFTIDTEIPYDDTVRRAERDGIAPIDWDGESKAVRALRELADKLLASRNDDQLGTRSDIPS